MIIKPIYKRDNYNISYYERKVKEKWDEVFRTGKNTEEQMISFWGAKAKKYIGENWKEKVKFSYIKNKYKN